MPDEKEKDHKIITIGKWAGAIAGIIGLVATAWTGISRASTLIEKVETTAATIDHLKEAQESLASSLRTGDENSVRTCHDELTVVVASMRARAERDGEIITQLRIAIASIESARGGTRARISASLAALPVAGHPAPSPPSLGDTSRALGRVEALEMDDPLADLSADFSPISSGM